MTLRKLLFISLILIILNGVSANVITKDEIYPMKDNSSISLSQIVSFQKDIVSEYNKDFERYPPENKQLYHIFILNQSFKSTILLSYYGGIGFFFEESNISEAKFGYLGKNQSGTFLSGIPFSEGNIIEYNTWWDINGNSYGLETDISTLDTSYSRQLALNYYLHDYARYVTENARLKQIEQVNLQKLNNSLEELKRVYRSGDDLEKVKVTIQFYQLAEDVGFPDSNVKKILEDLKKENSTQINNSESSILSSSQIGGKSLNKSETTWSKIKELFNPFIEAQQIVQTIIFWGLLVSAVIVLLLLRKTKYIKDFFKKY